jgi:peptidoglycan/LPS O-acetylase OafA/YrhL
LDPWISYVALIGLALLALYLIEKPAQRQLRKWMGA